VRLTLFTLALVLPVAGAQPKKPDADAPGSPYARGQKMLDAYLKDQVKRIEAASLTDLTTKAEWEKRRPELRRQFLDMMGLWPLPPKTDLKATVVGTVDAGDFTVERLHFQSMPGLYVTANLYLPKPAARQQKYPTILYLCGHGNVVEGGVSFGSKVSYQYHPAWFASHGYVCLILDTLQLGEIQGLHHGTYRENMWWWQARGYTPGGVELWNAIRALDYLETRPEVDAKRIGLTGRSGGGASSWWLLAADDRPQAIVPVAGIADLYAHVCEGAVPRLAKGVIAGHCDCMFMVNTYRWDFATVAALAAPRPLLLGNSDADDIFPVAGYRRIAEKVRKVYALYDAEEKFQLLETKGPHRDTPELRIGINRWMNRWLKDDTITDVEDDLRAPLKPTQLKVFDELPTPRGNETIHERFVPAAKVELPADPGKHKVWWTEKRPELMEALKARVFAGWATDPPALTPTVAADVTHDGVRLRAIDFVSETAIELRLFVMTAAKVEKPDEVILSVLDDAGWERWCAGLGPEFAEALQLDRKPKRDEAMFAQNRGVMESQKLAFAAIAPRGIGVTRWAEPDSFDDRMIRRRFPLLGQTLDGQQVWDVRRAIAALQAQPDLKPAKLTLHGERQAAGIALYAGLFESAVSAFDLWHLPPSHHDGPTFLNVLRVLDTPQAVALASPRTVTLHLKAEADRAAWEWPLRLQKATGGGLVLKVVGGVTAILHKPAGRTDAILRWFNPPMKESTGGRSTEHPAAEPPGPAPAAAADPGAFRRHRDAEPVRQLLPGHPQRPGGAAGPGHARPGDGGQRSTRADPADAPADPELRDRQAAAGGAAAGRLPARAGVRRRGGGPQPQAALQPATATAAAGGVTTARRTGPRVSGPSLLPRPADAGPFANGISPP
jgi:dienelactone hydrolase